ncbi:hypothetical protein BCR42DRAFT_416415 [Absidia repens]|uniref:CRAL-TRIO domain-containing protein n=1 Tax=Absidia repens TaxID=90262 RepID=A0A1X2IEH5_9FUNG|nr:hypothetical protein BCR42DRAFT_416415 [Absidia repens]
MTTSLTEQTLVELNAKYLKSKPILLALETKLKQGLNDLALPQPDLAFALDFVQDHVTLFRFLDDCDFDESMAYGEIMDTVFWRRDTKIDQLAWDTIHPGFYVCDHQPTFAFFNKQDRFERPVVVVRMRHFPNFGELALSDTIPQFACLVMEIARKWTLELTRRNELKRSHDSNTNTLYYDSPLVLVSQIVVIIDISKSPMIPLEKRLIQELQTVTDDRFPGFFGSIYVMNFGWIYQGLWQMVKLMLSESAKSKINFPSVNEVKECIPKKIFYEVNPTKKKKVCQTRGTDDYEWTLETDTIIRKYGSGWKMETPLSLSPVTSPRSPTSPYHELPSSSPSLSISSYSSDDFYDAPGSPLAEEVELKHQHELPSQSTQRRVSDGYSSVYGTPGALTPIGIRSPSRWPVTNHPPVSAPLSTNHYFLDIPSFLASYFGSSSTSLYTAMSETTTSNNNYDGVCGVDLTYRLTNLALEEQQQQQQQQQLQEGQELLLDNVETVVVIKQQQQQEQTIGISRRYSVPGNAHPHFPHLQPSGTHANDSLKIQLRRSEQRLVRLTRRFFRLSFAYHGTLYWVFLYMFLRGPVEHSMKRLLAKMMVNSNSRTITLTSVGLAASFAGGLGASLSSSLGH